MNIVFEEIKKSIKDDATKYAANEEGVLEITEENDNYIAVYEDIDGFSREYTITNPDVITKEWIKELIIVTDSAKELEFIIDIDKLADFAASLDKNMLLTLENIVIVNDAEKDYDYLSALDDSFARMLEVSDLPDEHLVGLMWFSYQKVFVNLGSIIKATNELIDEGTVYDWEKEDSINMGIAVTLVHEIRHLAWANPYLDEDKLNKKSENEEEDAETYANMVCSNGIPWLIKKRKGE